MKNYKNLLFNIFISSVLSLSIIIFCFIIILNDKNLYYYCINKYHINQVSGLSCTDIKLNYDYIVDYLNSSTETEFKLPTIKSSFNGIYHFKEVKKVYKLSKFILISLVIIMFSFFVTFKNMLDLKFLKYSSFILSFICILSIISFLINFNAFFTLFHKVFFRNEYWLFDETIDPVILILPQQFFLICAILILSLITMFSILLYSLYKINL